MFPFRRAARLRCASLSVNGIGNNRRADLLTCRGNRPFGPVRRGCQKILKREIGDTWNTGPEVDSTLELIASDLENCSSSNAEQVQIIKSSRNEKTKKIRFRTLLYESGRKHEKTIGYLSSIKNMVKDIHRYLQNMYQMLSAANDTLKKNQDRYLDLSNQNAKLHFEVAYLQKENAALMTANRSLELELNSCRDKLNENSSRF